MSFPVSPSFVVKLLVYEFLTGGGCHSWLSSPRPSGSMLAEGAAMLDAVCSDLLSNGHHIVTLRDSRLPAPSIESLPGQLEAQLKGQLDWVFVHDAAEERDQLTAQSQSSDGVVLIAPETDGDLQRRAEWVAEAGGRLLSPSSAFIAVAANKRACCEILRAAGVPTPIPFHPDTPNDGAWPLISKPNDGCGSSDIRIVRQWENAVGQFQQDRCVEHVCEGYPVSVGVLCGPKERTPLPPCAQHLDQTLQYRGGRTPLARPEWNAACRHSAKAAVDALASASGSPIGFVGVDLVVSETAATVVEVNPRLTTSFVGLSQWFGGWLSETMVQTAVGADQRSNERAASAPADMDMRPVVWTASGRCQRLSIQQQRGME